MEQEIPPETTIVEEIKVRRCLSCEATFDSQWAGERICPRCKHTSAWRSGVAYRPSGTR